MPAPTAGFPCKFLRLVFTVIAIGNVTGANAQLCNGSLGDPAVNITFGAGGDANTGYAPTNAYTYTDISCPNDGFYTLTKSTSGCFGNTWHTVNKDHTGNGAFMLVNASYTPGDFFLTRVSDLCPNTTYEFAAWVVNVLNRSGIKPNLTFKIESVDGTVLGDYATGNIDETLQADWKQYGFYFTTPVNNAEIVLRITNNAPGGIGNDLGLDDITFRPCGPIITSSILNNPDTVDICEGNTNQYTLTAEASTEYVSPMYQWQLSVDSGKSWQDIQDANTLTYERMPTGPGRHAYRLAVNERNSVNVLSCRIASNTVAINVHPNPLVDAGPDRVLLKDDLVTLSATVTGEDPVFIWTPPDHLDDPTRLTPTASPTSSVTYKLSAESSFGCKNSDEVFVKVVAGIFVPTAFTPNNDGLNDRWHIPFLDPLFNASVSVYNRYGQRVYHVEGKTVDWDGNVNGQPQQTGIYVYHIRFKNGRPAMTGFLNIIR